MKNYKELQEEIYNTEKELKEIETEKYTLLSPVYDLINENSDILTSVLPNNLTKDNSRNLILRLKILKEEIPMLKLSQEEKDNVLDLISRVENDIVTINEKESTLEEKIVKLNQESEERKNFSLSKIKEIEDIDLQISKLTSGVNKRTKVLKEVTLEHEEQKAIQNIIDKNNDEIKELKLKKELLIQENNLSSDIELLNKPSLINEEETDILPQEKFIKKAADLDKSITELTRNLKQEMFENNKKIEEEIARRKMSKVLEEIPEQQIEIPYEETENGHKTIDLNAIKNKLIENKKENSEIENKEQEPEILSETVEEIVEEENNISEESFEEFYTKEELEEGDTVEESYINVDLMRRIKLQKNLRIILGIVSMTTLITSVITKGDPMTTIVPIGAMIANAADGIINDPEKKIINETRDNLEIAREINKVDESEEIKNNIDDITKSLYTIRNSKLQKDNDTYHNEVLELEGKNKKLVKSINSNNETTDQ